MKFKPERKHLQWGITAFLVIEMCIRDSRKISIIDQNEEYCIVDSGTTFGISQYDYIVRNGNSVKEEDILY